MHRRHSRTASSNRRSLLVPLGALALAIRLALVTDPASAQDAAAAADATTAPTLSTPAQASSGRATLSLVVFDVDRPLAGAELRVDGALRAATNADGAARLELPAGAHTLTVQRAGAAAGSAPALTLDLQVRGGESAEMVATLYPDAAPSIFVESSHQPGGAVAAADAGAAEEAGPPGVLQGRITGSEDGAPIANARVYVSGTPLDIQTDADGRFRAELPPGEYALSVIAANFATQTLDGISIASEQATARDIELTPAGMELPEFVVLEPFVEGSLASFVEERRTSAAVTDILGAEQISRAGDSDAAGALKRVTGISLVGGKFVYVRGFGERYSSVLLNGAQIPSPDPTRRVVPLDLFPADLLSGIVVQKTYSAEMPGEFAGGTIQLRTRGVPDDFLLRVQGTLGYTDGATGDTGLTYDGGGRDWLGYDDGSREAPAGLLPPPPSVSTDISRAVAAQGYAVQATTLDPNTGFAASIGDKFEFSDGSWSLGYIGALRYAQEWDQRTEQRKDFSLAAGELFPRSDFARGKTEQAVDTSAFVSSGLQIGERHRIDATALQVRQSTDEVSLDDGLLSGGVVEQLYTLEWIENELRTVQLGGEHSLPLLANVHLDWLYSDSAASREAPNRREYRYQLNENTGRYRFFEAINRWESLDDDVSEGRLGLRIPFEFGETRSLELAAGGSQLERERVSTVYRFRYQGNRPGEANFLPIEELLSPEFIRPGGLNLINFTSPTDAYTADQTLDAWFLSADGRWGDYRMALGARQEDNLQSVVTKRPDDPNAPAQVATIDTSDLLPSAAFTWAYSEAAQLRLGYARTVNRPDFRELSPSFFSDPILDISTQGNPNLVPAEVENIDLRWEYYFSPTESFSVALFSKEITNPIELVRGASSGLSLRVQNATLAENRGIEFDFYKGLGLVEGWQWMPRVTRWIPWNDLYVGANYARIDSEVDLSNVQGNIQTNDVRPLQGQSPYVANLSLSWLPEDGDYEATLLYNVSGPRIALVGVSGLPDVYEQPFHQLDFTLSAALPWEGWKAKLRLKNVLDDTVEFSQGGLLQNTYASGREIAISLEWRH